MAQAPYQQAAPAAPSRLATPAIPPKPKSSDYVPLGQVKTVSQALSHPETIDRFRAVAPRWTNAERLQRLCLGAIMANEQLQAAPMWTLVRACLQFGAIGIEPNSPLGHGYLIPFKSKGKPQIQSIVGYKGMILLASNSDIDGVRGDVVYRGDLFDYENGTTPFLRHRTTGSRYGREAEYVWSAFGKGQEFEVRLYGDVLEVRNRSSGYQYALQCRDDPKRRFVWESSPWVRDEHPMAVKTMIRSVLRFAPLSPERPHLSVAADLDARSESGERADFRSMNTGMDLGFITGLPEDVEDMTGHVQGSDLGGEEQQQQGGDRREDRQETKPAAGNGGKPAAQAGGTGGAGTATRGTPATAASQASTAQTSGPARGVYDGQPPGREGEEAGAGGGSQVLLYLMDASGEPEVNADGNFAIWTDATQWAAALRNRVENARPDQRQAIMEHNADTIAEAREASEAAGLIIDRMGDLVEARDPEPASPWAVAPAQTAEGGIDVTATIAALKAKIASCGTQEQLRDCGAANDALVKLLPRGSIRIVNRMFQDRHKAVMPAQQDPEPAAGTAAQVVQEEGEQQEQPQAEDLDLKRLQAMKDDIDTATNLLELDRITRSATHTSPLTRFDRDRPELGRDYRGHLAAKEGALRDGGNGT